jgi:hypothetical protein
MKDWWEYGFHFATGELLLLLMVQNFCMASIKEAHPYMMRRSSSNH